jgi:hypothetical protein
MNKWIASAVGLVLFLSSMMLEASVKPAGFDMVQEEQAVQTKEIEDALRNAMNAIKEGNREKAIELLAEVIMLLKNNAEFQVAKIFLCSEIRDYRDFTPKESNVLKAGEPLLVYIEPDGYRLLKEGNEYRIWVSLDASISNAQGEVIFQRNNWVNYKKVFPTPIIPFYLTNRLSDIPAGKYTYTVTLKDHHKNAFLTESLEFIVE